MEKYPDKPYLKYLGTNAISYYKARSAKNFEILSIVKCESENLYSDFTRCYAACRNYVMIGLYNTPDQRMYEHYDSFMGMLVMIMSVQRLFCSIFKQGISRDFYDDNIIRSLFESYNIPYIESISSDYQKVIAKKLNLLLQKKSSNSVLFDISSIFNFRGINIYKYYLVKDYKKDSEGNPIIIYKEICDEYGNTQQVVDYEKTFDIFFQKVNIESSDPIVEINDASNRVPYDTLTMGDPYWIEDSDLITKLYETNFNHVLSKYMSIDVIYDLAKLTYQTAYCMRMIIDDQRDFKLLTGGTDNHLILLDLTNKNITGKEAEKRLDEAYITTNKNAIPFDPNGPNVTSGIEDSTIIKTLFGIELILNSPSSFFGEI